MRTARRAFRAAVLAGALIFLAGCPYSSDVPLGDPASAVIDRALPGTWRLEDPETHEKFTLTFASFNGHEMVGFSSEGEGKPISAFRLFVTPVGGERFLNVQELKDDSAPQWYLARYRVSGDTLSLRLVDDGLFGSKTFSSPQALQEFVASRLADPRLFGSPQDETPDMLLTRAPK